MTQLTQATVYGLLQGGLFALVAVGFSLVWGVMNVVNLAHGAFVITGAYIAWKLADAASVPPLLGMLAVGLTLALVAFMSRTRMGLAIRATGMDRGAARLMGMRVRHVYAVTFGIAAALAGAAGAILGTVATFNPADAGRYTLQSFVIAVLGGLGNMWGALAGGILLGVVTAWGGQYLSGTLVNAISFGVLVVVLLVRPTGLLGRPYYELRQEA